MEKENTTALGLHLVAGAGDGVLTYSDCVADQDYVSLDGEKGKTQAEINKELRDAIKQNSGSKWYEEEE